MAKRNNHYDAAFEQFLRETRIPHVVVDEKRRSLLAKASLKSMDFIVYSRGPQNLLVDVKGRKFPSGSENGGHKWENWTTEDDVQSLLQWQQVFGDGFRGLFVFAYHLVDRKCADELTDLFDYRERSYSFYGVWADEYQSGMRPRSASWETVSLPRKTYRTLRSPICEYL